MNLDLFEAFDKLDNEDYRESEISDDINFNSFHSVCEELNKENFVISPLEDNLTEELEETEETPQSNTALEQDKEKYKSDLKSLVELWRSSKSKRLALSETGLLGLPGKYRDVIEAAKRASDKFTGNENKWPYQLQLLCNAWISETWVENNWETILSRLRNKNNTNAFERIDRKKENNKEKLSKNATAAKDSFDSWITTKEDGKLTRYSGNDIYYIVKETDPKVDFDWNKIKIDVKLVKKDPMKAGRFHKADFLLIFSIDEKRLFVRFTEDYKNYSDPIEIDINDIDKAGLDFLQVQPTAAIITPMYK